MWRAIKGYEGYYEVDDDGRVRSLDRSVLGMDGVVYHYTGRVMKATKSKGRDGNGYYVVNLRRNHKSKVVPIHRIVAETFIPNPLNLPTVNHIDGNKANNSVRNLEWATYSQNNQHAVDNGLRNPRGNKIGQISPDGKLVGKYKSMIEASRATGISYGMISHCINGRVYSAGGYAWKIIS